MSPEQLRINTLVEKFLSQRQEYYNDIPEADVDSDSDTLERMCYRRKKHLNIAFNIRSLLEKIFTSTRQTWNRENRFTKHSKSVES